MALKKDRIEIYPSRNGQWAFRYKRKNGKKIAASGETYHNHKDASDMVSYLFSDQIGTLIADVVTLCSHKTARSSDVLTEAQVIALRKAERRSASNLKKLTKGKLGKSNRQPT